jgi:dynein heavy chain
MLYINICRGLFEAHKLIYSFMMCTSIKRKENVIDMAGWNLLLRGAGLYNKTDQPKKPEETNTFVTDS